MLKKLILRLKRYFFYKSYGFYPEDLKKLIYVQKYLDKFHRKDKTYNEYIKEKFI